MENKQMAPPVLCKMEFVRDPDGKEMLVKDGQYQVMMEWERPYMQACINALRPTGDVLEVGFGCGYSATYIQTHRPRSHTIIEYHPVVAERARAWALDCPGVIIIEDTWQHALPSLGNFDCIFFDDYPLEPPGTIEKYETDAKGAGMLVKAGKALLANVVQKITHLHTIRYRDADVNYFMKKMEKKSLNDKKMLPRFFHDLYKQGQITKVQWEGVGAELVKREWVSAEELEKMHEPIEPAARRSDRFFTFLELCLAGHMKKGSRFSCYLEDPISKYEDPLFLEKIILNPALDYSEQWIDIEVSPHCRYYRGDSALVMTITKQMDA
jgi:protein-L-isoaspartate O-methyltransferase